jgi:DTW domain-containing protein YfiP
MTQAPPIKRLQCTKCGYPQTTCLCPWIKAIESPVKLVILQHPKESKHAKNTVKLLQLGLTNLKVIQGENASDFAEFAKLVAASPKSFVLCYPHANSKAIEALESDAVKDKAITELTTVILIDASWRKALKMWHLNPWLQQISGWHFSHPPPNKYEIRHTTQKNSLSTLESVAYLLTCIYNLDCTGLYQLFEQMQTQCFTNQQQKD